MLLALLLLAGSLWSHAAFAQADICDLQSTGSTFQSGPTGSTLNYNFNVVDVSACDALGGTRGTVSVYSDSTGGATISSGASYSGISTNSPFAFSVALGPTPGGSVTILIQCATGCGTNSQLYYYASTDNVYSFTANSPSSGSASIGTNQSINLTTLYDLNGNPAQFQDEAWQATPTAGVTLSPAATTTDASGLATASFSASRPGTYTVTATRICPLGAPPINQASIISSCTGPTTVVFTITVSKPGLVIVSGNNQTGQTDTPAPAPLVVQATEGGIGTSNVPITWSVLSGGATITSTSGNTDASGNAQATVTFGPTQGPVVVRAERGDMSRTLVDFTLVGLKPTLTLIKPTSPPSGDGQSGQTGAALPLPLVAQAQLSGSPQYGVTVNWSVLSGSAVLGAASSMTDQSGNASVSVTLGATAGPIVIRAERGDAPRAFVDFRLSATSPRLTLIKPTSPPSGDFQSGQTGTTLPLPLIAQAQSDGAPQANVTVNWSVVSGSASLSAASTITDGSGNSAPVNVTLGAIAGSIVIRAARADAPGVYQNYRLQAFTVTLTLVKPVIVPSGDGQSGAPGTTLPGPLIAQALKNGLPQSGVVVNWAVLSGTATLSAASSVSGASGATSVSVTLGNTPGPVQIRASRADAPSAIQDYTVTVVAAPPPPTDALDYVAPASGAGSVPADQSLALSVRATQNGAPPESATIFWRTDTPASSNVSPTSQTVGNGLSIANFTATAAGTYLVSACWDPRGTLANCFSGGLIRTFTITVTAVVASSNTLTIVSGNNQNGLLGTRADAPLLVRLTNSTNQPVFDETINWQVVSGSAALDASSGLTDESGQVQIGFDFGSNAGPIVIRASTASATAVDFNATVLAPGLIILSGNNQTAAPGSPLPADFVVQVVLPTIASIASAGNPVGKPQSLSGVPIQWQVSSGGGNLSQTTSITDSSGHASNHLTLGPSPGTNTVHVTAPGGASTTFTATTSTVTITATLRIVSGNGQQSLVPNAPSAPLVVALIDSNENPVANAVIHWSGSNATLASSTSTTDANGRASNTAYVTAPGGAAVSASSSVPAAGPVTFNLDAGISHIAGLTPQQFALANAIDNACPALGQLSNRTPAQQDFYLRCLDLAQAAGPNPGQVQAALDQLFANIAFVQSSAAQLVSDSQFTNIKARIAALRSGTNGSSFGGLALNGANGSFPIGLAADSVLGLADGKKAKQEIGSDFDRWGFFASGVFGRGNADPRSVVPGYSFQTNGITAGVDYRYSDSLIFGVTAGYAKYASNLDAGGGNLDTTGWSLSAYSTLYRKNSWYVDGVLTFGHNSFDITRHIFYSITTNAGTTSIDQKANSRSNGDSFAGAFTMGRDFQKGPWSFGPYLRGTYTRLSFGNANETLVSGVPGSGLGLAIKSRDLISNAVVFGGKVTYATSHDWGVLIPHMQFEWEHEFQNDPNRLEARFLADPTATPILVHGATVDTDFGRLGFGLSFIFTGGRSGFVYYEKTVGRSGITQDNLALGIRLEF